MGCEEVCGGWRGSIELIVRTKWRIAYCLRNDKEGMWWVEGWVGLFGGRRRFRGMVMFVRGKGWMSE